MTPYSYKSVTNAILTKMWSKGENISPLKLQKLLYYTCGYYLAANKGTPLIDRTFKAWDYGPVLPALYRHFRHIGNRLITFLTYSHDPISGAMIFVPSPSGDALLDHITNFVADTYGPYTAAQLSEMTHADDSPWSKTRKANPGIRNPGIDRKDLMNHFSRLVIESAEQSLFEGG